MALAAQIAGKQLSTFNSQRRFQVHPALLADLGGRSDVCPHRGLILEKRFEIPTGILLVHRFEGMKPFFQLSVRSPATRSFECAILDLAATFFRPQYTPLTRCRWRVGATLSSSSRVPAFFGRSSVFIAPAANRIHGRDTRAFSLKAPQPAKPLFLRGGALVGPARFELATS